MPGTAVAPHPGRELVAPRIVLTPKLAARIVRYIRDGANVTAAAGILGNRTTLYVWLQVAESGKYPNGIEASHEQTLLCARFRHAFERAQAHWELRATRTLALAGRSAPGTYDWRAHHEHLKHAEATRARWREHRELRITQEGTVSHEHRVVAQMTDAELAAVLPAEWRELLPDAVRQLPDPSSPPSPEPGQQP